MNARKTTLLAILTIAALLSVAMTTSAQTSLTYPIVDTNQGACYDANQQVTCPGAGSAFYGQDGQYAGNLPSYTDNGDGTVTDTVTGLTWQQSPDTNGDGVINSADKLTYDQASAGASSFTLAGYDDWRLPTIKELYSLILFDGLDVSGLESGDGVTLTPFIDNTTFDFGYGDTSAGERLIDSQFASSTLYVSTTMGGGRTMFGVNLADGRIKGYPADALGGGGAKGYYVLYVRGNTTYGENAFADNGDGTISDAATGLMWMQADSVSTFDWDGALTYCESLSAAGYDDWRLPNAKELQSLVDYSRSPDTTGSAAIDPLFSATAITNEGGQTDYAAYWSSTTHLNMRAAGNAAYVSFGRALGYMNGRWMDVHGAGAQRSDPKGGDASAYPTGHGPQGDAIRVQNMVRCVRDGAALSVSGTPTTARSGMTVNATSTGGTDAGQPQGGQPPQGGQNGQPPQGGQPPQSGQNGQPPQGGQGQPPQSGQGAPQGGPDLTAAAAQLGVTVEQLQQALGSPPPDLQAAAAQLGVTVEQLRQALGTP